MVLPKGHVLSSTLVKYTQQKKQSNIKQLDLRYGYVYNDKHIT